MKLYNPKQYVLGVALLASLSMTSCHKDLDRLPTNIETDRDAFADMTATKKSLAKVYGAYALTGNGTGGDIVGIDEGASDFLRNYFNLQTLPTEEAICTWGDEGLGDLHNLSWSSSNAFVKGLYYRSLYQIKLASDFLIKSAGRTEAEAEVFRAEARFLRAFQYWVMMDIFANPPFIDENTGVGKVYPKQIQRADLFKYIEQELLAIENTLLAPKANEYGRADRAAAWALLSRLYLNAEVYTGTAQYAKAAEYAEKVIASGAYSLHTTYANLFLTDSHLSNPEAILSINYDGLKSQTWGGTTFLINSSTSGDAATALGINWGVGGWGGNRATKALADLFDKSNDKRYLMGFKEADITDVKKFEQGVWVYKFRNVSSSGQAGQHSSFSDVDYPLFRLAEMYLNYAEAAARGAADQTKGLTYLNTIRRRAYGNISGDFSTLKLEDIIDERGRELYWEGFRRTDLIRFGLFTSSDYVWPWKGGVATGRGVSDHLKIYPLPADDVQANSVNLKQNPNY